MLLNIYMAFLSISWDAECIEYEGGKSGSTPSLYHP